MTFIYSQVNIIETDNSIVFRTKLIKENNGKYYYWNFYKQFIIEDVTERVKYVNEFHKEVYHTIILGKVDVNLKMADGTPLFELATYQISEKERIMNYLNQF